MGAISGEWDIIKDYAKGKETHSGHHMHVILLPLISEFQAALEHMELRLPLTPEFRD